MNKTTTKSRRIKRLANSFGILGYIGVLLEWTWAAALYLPMLIGSSVYGWLTVPPEVPAPAMPAPAHDVSLVGFFVMIAITGLAIVATALVIVRLPIKVGQVGQKVTSKTAAALMPLARVTSLKKVPATRLSAQIIALLKLVGIILPYIIILPFIVGQFEAPLSLGVLVTVMFALIVWSIFWFCLQYIIAIRA